MPEFMQNNHERISFYLDELSEWGERIDYYHQETEEIETKLYALIRRNSVPHIAEQVESRMTALSRMTARFITLQTEITSMETLLRMPDNHPPANDKADEEINRRQALLRDNMQSAEKACINTLYECHQFLSDTLKP